MILAIISFTAKKPAELKLPENNLNQSQTDDQSQIPKEYLDAVAGEGMIAE